MKDEKKDYTRVTALSEEYRSWRTSVRSPTSQEILMWQAEFQLVIAQQLTIIAGHLGKIVKTAEDATNGTN